MLLSTTSSSRFAPRQACLTVVSGATESFNYLIRRLEPHGLVTLRPRRARSVAAPVFTGHGNGGRMTSSWPHQGHLGANLDVDLIDVEGYGARLGRDERRRPPSTFRGVRRPTSGARKAPPHQPKPNRVDSRRIGDVSVPDSPPPSWRSLSTRIAKLFQRFIVMSSESLSLALLAVHHSTHRLVRLADIVCARRYQKCAPAATRRGAAPG